MNRSIMYIWIETRTGQQIIFLHLALSLILHKLFHIERKELGVYAR